MRIDAQRTPGRLGQVLIERAGDTVLDHIDGSGHGISGHRHAAGHGLQIHQAESVGAAREHHDIGCRKGVGEVLTEAIAGKYSVRKLLLQAHPFRPITDDDLAARPGHSQECADVLFHRDSSNIGGNGARHVEKVFAARLEKLGIDTALPAGEILEAVRGEFAVQ